MDMAMEPSLAPQVVTLLAPPVATRAVGSVMLMIREPVQLLASVTVTW